ncbi:uncharacterized protein B0T23DRAFT_102446 [Neurospora hispaniola]|uniref:Uncharacterized protein n=1 Tax=Neurospora hispaniola TaxID=588809 RepID=A0AAJ0MSB7_9PEZI|nr:hypothetical protein B0T23DRAFT_102446 [Neurospora hispaniola]
MPKVPYSADPLATAASCRWHDPRAARALVATVDPVLVPCPPCLFFLFTPRLPPHPRKKMSTGITAAAAFWTVLWVKCLLAVVWLVVFASHMFFVWPGWPLLPCPLGSLYSSLAGNRRLPREYIPHGPEELGEALARHQQEQR